jgi:microcystin-dependent protein
MTISNVSNGLRSGVCTSSTRPTSPYVGQLIFETDTFNVLFWNGSIWQGSVPIGTVNPFAGSSAPGGWLLCDGRSTDISRTTYSGLFSVIGTTYGSGDGSTTFNLPDLRGRVIAGEDDMGGTAANRLTAAGSGINGLVLGAAGGAQTHTLTGAQSGVPEHSHANTLSSNTVASSGHRHEFGFSLLDNFYAATGSNAGMSQAGAYRYSTGAWQGATSAGTVSDTRRDATSASFGQSTRMASFGDTQTPSANTTVGISNVVNSAANAAQAHQNTQPTIVLNYIIKV